MSLWTAWDKPVDLRKTTCPSRVVTWPDVVHRLWKEKKRRGPAWATVPPVSAGGGKSPRIEVRRSTRRRRTVSAYRDGDVTVVMLPARMSRAEERRWIDLMLHRLEARDRRSPNWGGDAELLARARRLAGTYLDGSIWPERVKWVDNQNSRWGSCTPEDATIRLSARLRVMPAWVVDYVLVHELAHLREPGHGPAFWGLVGGYPRAGRARGFLEGVVAAAALDLSEMDGGAAG